jgi:Right handed beta helix region
VAAVLLTLGCSSGPAAGPQGPGIAGGNAASGGSSSIGAAGSSGAGTAGSSGGSGSSVAGSAGAGAGGGGVFSGSGGGGDAGSDSDDSGEGGSAGSPEPFEPAPLDRTACVPGRGRQLHVSPTGSATGDGLTPSTAYDFDTARSQATAGDTLLLQPGKYTVPYQAGSKNTLVLSRQGSADQRIRVIAQGGRAEFDFSFPEQAWVQDSYGFLVSGSYWSLCRIDITRAGYQGAYVTGQHNTFEDCTFHDNRNTGLEINKGGAYTSVVNCDSFRNYDPKKLGSMADGFGPKETQGPGNRFYGCRAWENSDDGFDAYESPEVVVFERSYAFRNGVDVWGYDGFAGNGNGFKVGGAARQANHRLTQCAAFANPVKGFDQNNNTGGLTLFNCLAFGNGTNFALRGALNAGQRHDLRNNVSVGASDAISNASELNNSWNLSSKATSADFEDLEVSHGMAPRAADGSLPNDAFLRLAPGSPLIDSGVDVGLPYEGEAPDLGVFEAAAPEGS